MERIGAAPEETKVAAESTPLLDGMSLALATERGNAALYQQYALETEDPALKAHWERFGQRVQAHAQLAEGAITALRGDPSYRSAGAAEAERCSEAMRAVGAPGGTGDLFRLGYLVCAETLARLYWRGVSRVVPRLRDPAAARVLRETAASIESEKNQHIAWNTSALESRITRAMAGR